MDYPKLANESDLLIQTALGNEKAFALLYNHYSHRIAWYVRSTTYITDSDYDDVRQEVFLTLWERRDFLVNVESFNGYLLKATRNYLLNSGRHKQVRERAVHNYTDSIKTYHNDTYDGVCYKYFYKTTLDIINSMPDKYMEVCRLYLMYDLTYEQIATELNISRQRVGQLMTRAKELWSNHPSHVDWLVTVIILISICYAQ